MLRDRDALPVDGDDLEPSEWASPWSYPTRCTNERALAIARSVLRGASVFSAAMKLGIPRRLLTAWMDRGEAAHERDANAEDVDAPYLNLFLKVVQAVGIVTEYMQHRAYADSLNHSAQWWLLHYPEMRAEWGGTPTPDFAAVLISSANTRAAADQARIVDADEATAPRADIVDLRFALKTIIEAGAAVPVEDVSRDDSVLETAGTG